MAPSSAFSSLPFLSLVLLTAAALAVPLHTPHSLPPHLSLSSLSSHLHLPPSSRDAAATLHDTSSPSLAYDPTDPFPPPFTRLLAVRDPPLHGTDVYILQNLLNRWRPLDNITSVFDTATSALLSSFQAQHSLTPSGALDPATATAVLQSMAEDGYRDDGASAASLGYMYKVHVPVHRNRSIEMNATLYDAHNNVLLSLRVRTHGHDAFVNRSWPDFNNTDPGLNMFSSDGNTPTGLMLFDLNSPEDDPRSFGPYPVNRAVQGLRGNAAFLVPNVRNGILLHTGEWPGWQPPEDMPNSSGCIHSWPEMIQAVWQLLVAQGVEVRPNTDGKLPYPYRPQGLLSVEQADA